MFGCRLNLYLSAMRKQIFWLVMVFALLAGACSTAKKPQKKLKPGKPIPCPQKDC